MKILGIMGSPRIKGNTDLLLDEALRGAKSRQAEVEKLVVDKMKITPCREYYGCVKDGNCNPLDRKRITVCRYVWEFFPPPVV